ncbi:MAG: PqqD family protein [Polyangiaceae bacterium]|nr:PqqD family protein [Polyangiaceae bacterium]
MILHAESAEYFGLNHVGSRIWALLAQGLTVRELTHTMASEYGVTSDRVENDLVPFLTALVEAGLAEVVVP